MLTPMKERVHPKIEVLSFTHVVLDLYAVVT